MGTKYSAAPRRYKIEFTAVLTKEQQDALMRKHRMMPRALGNWLKAEVESAGLDWLHEQLQEVRHGN